MENDLKRRNGCVSAWLYIVILANIVMVVGYAILMFNVNSSDEALGYGVCSILGLVNVLGAILLMRWNKIGFYMFLISNIISIIVNITLLDLAAATAVASIAAIAIWWAILQIRSNGVSAWSQLETGWDYKHCRHLYQFFSIIGIVLFILTLIAVNKNHNEPSEDIFDDDLISEVVAIEPVEELDSCAYDYDNVIAEEPSEDPISSKETHESSQPSPVTNQPNKTTVTKEDESSIQRQAETRLKAELVAGNKDLPIDLGNGIILIRMYLSGDTVMYIYECDENTISMENLENNRSTLISEIKKTLSNPTPEVAEFMKLCVKSGKNVGYTYVGDTSGKKITIRFSNAELKRLI